MSKNNHKEACKLFLSTDWTPALMEKTLKYIMLNNPAVFIRALNAELPQSRVQIVINRYPPEKKIAVIKAFRELTGANLGEAKSCIESHFPIHVKTLPKESDDTATAIGTLEAAGAVVSAIPV